MVATCGGAFLGLAPLVGLIGAAVWLVVVALTRYASVSSIVAAVSLPVGAVLLGEPWPVLVSRSRRRSACSCSTAGTSPGCARAPSPASG
jgi:glycerol-3-phosphate acyltransferase PlsY